MSITERFQKEKDEDQSYFEKSNNDPKIGNKRDIPKREKNEKPKSSTNSHSDKKNLKNTPNEFYPEKKL
jgi:hypothetical protein